MIRSLVVAASVLSLVAPAPALDVAPAPTGAEVHDVAAKAGPLALAIPAVARVRGAGAFFTSRLDAFNNGAEDMTIEVVYTPRADLEAGTLTATWDLAAGVAETIDDPLGHIFGLGDDDVAVGSLLLEVTAGTAEDLKVQTVVFARKDSGEEYGQYFPAIPVADALVAGQTGYLSTTENAQRNRVNVGLMAVEDGTSATVRLVGPIGRDRGDSTVSFTGGVGDNMQINNVHEALGSGPMPNLLVEVEVTTGSLVTYASVLDGNLEYEGTSDPTTILPATTGSTRVTLLELGTIQGINEFSGSATITNLSDTDTVISAEYYDRGTPGVSGFAQIGLDAGDTAGFQEIVRDLFGFTGSVGTVVLEANQGASIHATGREFAVFRDGGNQVTGTAGQLMAGMSDADRLTRDNVWHFIGLKQATVDGRTERSNLAVFNPGANDVDVSVDLFNGADAAEEGTYSFTVRGGELIQVNNIIAAANPAHDAADKRIRARVSGPVFARAFRVNVWGDPVTNDVFPDSEGLTVTSPAFEDGDRIPDEHGCWPSGDYHQPSLPFEWSGAPHGTRSYVLLLDDPDAFHWVHWAVTDIPAGAGSLAAGASGAAMPAGSIEHVNSWGETGYGAPCPPPGEGHLYRLQLFARAEPSTSLDTAGRDGEEISAELAATSLAVATLTGRYPQ